MSSNVKIVDSSTKYSFSATNTLSNSEISDENKEFFRIFNLTFAPGNIIPNFWYQRIVDEKNRPDLTAIVLLSEVLAQYRFATSSAPCAFISLLCDKPTLVGRTLRTSNEHFMKKIHIPKEKVRRGFVRLEELKIIERGVCNILVKNNIRCNKLMLTINKDFIDSCFKDAEKDIRVKKKTQAYPSDSNFDDNSNYSDFNNANTNEESDNHKVQSTQISSHHIRNKKNKIKNIRSIDESNILNKNSQEKVISKSNTKVETDKSKSKGINIDLDNITSNNFDSHEKDKQKRNQFYFKPKQLSDFYPLTKEECEILQSSSGRDFSLGAMNEILQDMSRRLSDRGFKSKKGFLSYMAKAFRYEMRDAVKISNENFKIKANQTEEESRAEERERYLTEIEYSTQVTPEWHLKKKLACVLESMKAYNFLKAYRSINIEENSCTINLREYVKLTYRDKEIILNQVKATHEKVTGEGSFMIINTLEIEMPEQIGINKREPVNRPLMEGVWGKIRLGLINYFGEGYDKAWFSKLEAKVDEEKQTINLVAPSKFFKDWINDKYLDEITRVANSMNFKLLDLN